MIQVMDITPELAQKMLDTTVKNRNINKQRVYAYARDMENGNFHLNNDIIAFDQNRHLTNGQHRLRAVIISNTTIPMYVGIIEEGTIFDRGQTRSQNSALYLSGLIDEDLNSKECTSMVNAYFFVKYGTHFGDGGMTDVEKAKFMMENKKEILDAKSLSRSKRGSRALCRNSGISAAILGAILLGIDETKLSRFCEIVNLGFSNGSSESSAIVLRNYLLENAGKNGGTFTLARASITEQAIHDFVRGRSRQRNYKPGPHPYIK